MGANFEILRGKTLKRAYLKSPAGDDEIHFVTTDGEHFKMFHRQSCSETVRVEDICGDLADLLGSPILLAEEVSNPTPPPGFNPDGIDSYTWTFYKLATIKGSVCIRWYGESNGYYSESVEFINVGSEEES